MLYSIRFNCNFNNFNAGDVIKFRRGSFFTAPFGGGKTSLLKLIFEHLVTGDNTYIESTQDGKNFPVFFLTFCTGQPELFFHNVSEADIKMCNDLINNNDIVTFYALFRDHFTDAVLIADDIFVPLMGFDVPFIRDICTSRLDEKDAFTNYRYKNCANNQFIVSGTNNFGTYYNEHELYYIPAKTWVSSNFLNRLYLHNNNNSVDSYMKKERSTGYVVRIAGIEKICYNSANYSHDFKTIADKFVESSNSITSSPDAAKIYATKTGAEKIIKLFKERTKNGSISLNNRKCFKSGNSWYNNLRFTKVTYDILSTDELNDMLFNGEEFL